MSVLLADDEAMFVDALAAALTSRGRRVLATTTRADAVADLVREHRPRVCILDLRFDGELRDDLPQAITRAGPGTAVLLLTGTVHAVAWGLYDRGHVQGLASKSCTLDGIDYVVGELLLGRHALAGVKRPVAAPPSMTLLTERERDVLALLVRGASTPEIGTALGIGQATTRSHVQHLLQKLGVHTRVQAVRHALAEGLLGAET